MSAATLGAATWPAGSLAEATRALARRTHMSPVATSALPPQIALDVLCELLNVEAEPVEAAYPDVPATLRRLGPALIELRIEGETRYAALLDAKGGQLRLLTPSLDCVRLDVAEVAASVREGEASEAAAIAGVIGRLGPGLRDAGRTARTLREHLRGGERIRLGWLLRPGAGAPLAAHLREQRAVPLLAGLIGAHALFAALWVLSWWLLGVGALTGVIELGWLAAWALLLLSAAPLRLLASWFGGLLAVRAGLVLKRRLLLGALRLAPDEVRHLGVGQILGSAMEGELVEQMAIGGGFLTLTAVIELLFALAVLALGAGGPSHAALMAVWIVVSAYLGWRYLQARRGWTDRRLGLTNDMVEGMAGHRTRRVQEPRERWNEAADGLLGTYHGEAARMDRAAARLHALIPRGGFLLGLIGLVPALVVGHAGNGALAVGVGGVLLAWHALRELAEGLERFVGAGVAWESVAHLWKAAARPAGEAPAPEGAASHPGGRDSNVQAESGGPPLDARNLGFRYAGRPDPVFAGASLRVAPGERILVRGASGSGKSTLAALLAGLRSPASGLVLLGGLDLTSLGRSGWRRGVTLVPQAQENHVLAGPLAFNLLMGRGWPATARDLEEAAAVCDQLGLSPLIERMPSGLAQWVGETGWQLSHGERDRVFLARALLQRSGILILDESLAALDPITLGCVARSLACVGPALVVIAHP